MNVLPPQAAPSAPSSTRTTCPSGSGATDEAAGFQRLLSDHVGGGHAAVRQGQAGDSAEGGTSDEADHEAGAVAAAVHGAIAAWRADPGDVALGTHLRQVLEGAVEQATATAASGESAPAPGAPAAGELPIPSDASTPAPAPAPASAPAPAPGVAPAALPAADPAPVVAGAQAVPEEMAAPTVADETVVSTETAPDGAPVPTHRGGQSAPTDTALPAVATATASVAPTSAPATVPADRAGLDARVPENVVAAGRRPRAAEPAVAATEPVPTSGDGAGEAAELLTGTRTETASGAAARTSGPAATSAATLDRVMRAVEALEHAPPPRRLSLDVEGVQLTVAMQGEEVTVAVRSGADTLAPGWQRDLAAALRGRGLDLATDAGTGHASGRGDEGRQDRSGRSTPEPGRAPTSTIPSTQAAEPAGLRL